MVVATPFCFGQYDGAGRGAGSVETSEEDKRKLAQESLAYNLSKPAFREMFPQVKLTHTIRERGARSVCRF
jgi:hypothetical protein